MIASYPTPLPVEPNAAQSVWLSAEVRRFIYRHHNTLKGTYGASFFATVLLPGDAVVLLAGDDPDGLTDHIHDHHPDHLSVEITMIEDVEKETMQ